MSSKATRLRPTDCCCWCLSRTSTCLTVETRASSCWSWSKHSWRTNDDCKGNKQSDVKETRSTWTCKETCLFFFFSPCQVFFPLCLTRLLRSLGHPRLPLADPRWRCQTQVLQLIQSLLKLLLNTATSDDAVGLLKVSSGEDRSFDLHLGAASR